MKATQDDYFAAYGNLKLTRDAKGILVVQFHSDGGPFIMTAAYMQGPESDTYE